MLAPPSGFPRQAQLEPGPFDFYQVIGITETEVEYARSHVCGKMEFDKIESIIQRVISGPNNVD